VGVKFIAAFRGRSFGRGLGDVCVVVAFVDLDFCASCSGMLIFSDGSSNRISFCAASGGRVSFTCGMCGLFVPAIEVSGIPVLRGGGGGDWREYGVYAVLVCIFRFEDDLYGL